MDTKRFNDEHAEKSRAVCERIEREDAERRSKLADLMDVQLKGELGRAKAEADGWRGVADRRLKHIEECESALKKRNERVAELEKQVSDLRAELANAKVLSERERQILYMWPRFEDGEYVWFGDRYEDWDGWKKEVAAVQFERNESSLLDCDGFHTCFSLSEHVKRPAPKVLDADGVEIKVGDTVYGIGRTKHEFEVIDPHHIDPEVGEAFSVRCYDCDESEECHCRPELLAHTLPDSWGRLELDADSGAFHYCVLRGIDYERGSTRSMMEAFASDIIRRAKALAGVEVGE